MARYPQLIGWAVVDGLTLRLERTGTVTYRLLSTDKEGKGHMWPLCEEELLRSLFNQMRPEKAFQMKSSNLTTGV